MIVTENGADMLLPLSFVLADTDDIPVGKTRADWPSIVVGALAVAQSLVLGPQGLLLFVMESKQLWRSRE